ncbi:3-deoxy-D-manno-octulosonic acid transferase [Acetonema longum]|uniref:3-deoxy-D-manno-octulosonic acid transferase n=1 Tax=Acetonema longum DSM 6540 TaxID=1009370 RepID=F7NM07_9FIRM|nr:3-deoxy-D-manno-octulosonic acid transferase [Acetonema longum]EGO62933.1 tetraacyldisaccharide 4'-kinase [Acetonema longum DSM 6540]
MWLIYNIVLIVLILLATPLLLLRLVRREKGFGHRVRQSLGIFSVQELEELKNRRCIWVHAASVGEMVAASPIVKEIKRLMPDYPVLVSVLTASGYKMANNIIGGEADVIIHFPADLPWIVNKVVSRIQPRAFVMVETELWPNFLAALRQHDIPVMMVNGRISDKSVRRYHYLGKVLSDMLSGIRLFSMQSNIDAKHIIQLGADPRRVVVGGNTKFDQTYTEITTAQKQEICRMLRLRPDQPVIVAGSTHKREEEMLLAAFLQARQDCPGLQMVLAPREISRAEEIRLLVQQQNWVVAKRTALTEEPDDRPDPDIIILDTIGELGKVYSIGEIIFVGGSLISHGGHNILEPAAHGKPVLVGPHMFNFKEIYALLTGRDCCLTVHNQQELTDTIGRLLADRELRRRMGENSLTVVNENRGAARRNARHLQEMLAGKTQSD